MRFQQKRRIESARSSIFRKYLQYGGININSKFGMGKEMGDEEAMQAGSQTTLAKELQGLEVNFEKVARGYL